ncbi:hypothetical protein BX661DRAFT_185351, partial [Kickxella alabastrina]|uniref:uncharacterized protein n=1 Tax=Kickxella alabastrina TaxID=61397 RepID=UPI00221E64B6
MSSFDSLPHTVTTLILDYAVSDHMDTIGAWKTKLPLLATCKQWRTIGKSLVYKTIYFESKPPGIDRSSSNDDEQGLEPGSFGTIYDNSRVASNMNLVKTVNAMCKIKRMAIKMSHSEHVRWLTLVLKREHCADAGCWNTIELLQLSIDHDNRVDTPSEKDIGIKLESNEWERELASLLAATKQLMPVILTLELRGNRTSVTEPFYNRIIEQYSGRVQSVSNVLPANICVATLPENLTCLVIVPDLTAAQLISRTCKNTLQLLNLNDTPREFSWMYFQSSPTASDIVFKSLRTLKVYYALVQPSNCGAPKKPPGSWRHRLDLNFVNRVCFPRLETLGIFNRPTDCDVLLSDEYPLQILDLELANTLLAKPPIESVSVQRVENVHLLFDNILYKYSDEFYRTLNYMLSGINVLQMATLKIRNMDFILDSGRTNWVNLTHLRFDKLDCRRLFRILPRTPSLISMTVDNFITKGVMGMYLEDEEEMSESIEPLASNVQNLALVNRTRSDTKDWFIQSIVIILMHMPLVRNFCNTSDTKNAVKAYIDKYKDKYPHFRELAVYDHLPRASHGDKLFF